MSDNAIQTKKFSGWSVTIAAMVIVFCHMTIRGSFATLINGMVAATGWSTGAVSAGSSLFMVMYGLFAFFVGTYIGKPDNFPGLRAEMEVRSLTGIGAATAVEH